MSVLIRLILLYGVVTKALNSSNTFVCDSVARVAIPRTQYEALENRPAVAPYKWVCYIDGPDCTAFIIRHRLNGVLFITSASCLLGRNARTQGAQTIRCPVYGIRNAAVGDYTYHPNFLARQNVNPPLQSHDADLAAIHDTSFRLNLPDGSPEGFTIEKPDETLTTLTVLGFNGDPSDRSTQYKASCENVEYVKLHIEYKTQAEWGDCIVTGSPIYHQFENGDYRVFAVNQNEIVYVNDALGNPTPYNCYDYFNLCNGGGGGDGGGGYPGYPPNNNGGGYPAYPGYEELLETDATSGYGGYAGYGPPADTCQLPEIVDCEYYGSRIDSTMVEWKHDGFGWLAGDPHFMTFDRKPFDVYNNCEYTLTRIGSLVVNAKFWTKYWTLASIKSLSVTQASNRIIMGQQCDFKVYATRFFRRIAVPKLPRVLRFMTISRSPKGIVVQTSSGVSIKWDCRHDYHINVPNTLRGQVEGLLGNYDGILENDCRTATGQFTEPCSGANRQFDETWVESWTLPRSDCDNNEEGNFAEHTVLNALSPVEINEYCSILQQPPFDNCFNSTERSIYVEDCKVDLGAVSDNQVTQSFCDSAQVLADACISFYDDIIYWRNDSKPCPVPSCDVSGTVYNPCSNPCYQTCDDYRTLVISDKCGPKVCVAQCSCAGENALKDGKCVPYGDC